MISPQIDLGDGSIAYDLKFDLAFTYWNSAADAYNVGNQKFAVAISTDGGQTWDMENAMIWDSTSTTQEGFFINDIYPSGQRVVMDLSEYTGNIVVGFYGEQLVSGGDNRIHIDNFQVVEHVDCLDLLSFDLAVATPTSVAISWPVPVDSDYDAVIIYNNNVLAYGVCIGIHRAVYIVSGKFIIIFCGTKEGTKESSQFTVIICNTTMTLKI